MGEGIRTRFAPSPTGYLHMGSIRTALFNYLFASHYGGTLVLRIEDTDLERSAPEFERSIIEDLGWLGISWTQGTAAGEVLRQSERVAVYKGYAETLVTDGKAYPCYCTHERLEKLRKTQLQAGTPPRYDGRCRTPKGRTPKGRTPKGEGVKGASKETGAKPAIRFKVESGTARIEFPDLVHGLTSFDPSTIGDFIVLGSDDIATYNLAVVVDDGLMNITHVIRGDDHLSNTPRQMLLQRALGFGTPKYMHLPLVMAIDGKPLGKRNEELSVMALRDAGYLPEALINAAAHLGWAPPGGDTKLLTLEELVDGFSPKRLSRSPSTFDTERLRRFNKLSLEAADSGRLAELISPCFDDLSFEGGATATLENIVGAAKGAAFTLAELRALIAPLLARPVLTGGASATLREESAKEILRTLATLLKAAHTNTIDEDLWGAAIGRVKAKTGLKGKSLFMPIRAALTGITEGLELETVTRLLGLAETIKRLEAHSN